MVKVLGIKHEVANKIIVANVCANLQKNNNNIKKNLGRQEDIPDRTLDK